MFYVKLDTNGAVERYPYTLTDLRRSTPNTSFPLQIDDETAAAYNCFPVTPAEPPAYDPAVNVERTAVRRQGAWVEEWVSTPATPSEITARTEAKAADVRSERNDRLAECDWTVLPDAPVDSTAWTQYRQELRDVTAQSGFPWAVTWPEQP